MNWDKFIEALDETELKALRSALDRSYRATALRELENEALTPEERKAVALHHITAIKMVAERTGWGLLKCKMLVDRERAVLPRWTGDHA